MNKNFYEVLEHPADLKIRVWGEDLSDVFINAAKAMAREQADFRDDGFSVVEGAWDEISVSAENKEELLVVWLSEILSLAEINKKLYTDFLIIGFSEKSIQAKIAGLKNVAKKTEIKAVTFSGLELKKANNNWQAEILFDI